MDDETLENLQKIWPDAEEFEPGAIAELFDMADLVDAIQRRIQQLAEATGMPSLHFFVLEELALKGGQAPLGELLAALNVPKQSATYMLDQLERDAYVERRKDTRDRRRLRVVLTRKGRRKVKVNLRPFYGAMLDALQSVPAGDRAAVLRGLARFRDALQRDAST